ncbi:MAG: mannose-1-phosphate guanylyltransferase [Lachnospiraceae bacterium]|nr:mannose-1-phosphate guanylyltransferase [Lachnospiraceae bacterium]
METVAVIMAGGQGRRFWPVSRKNKPKQFLSLMGDNRSMLQNTVERLNGTVPEENIYVVTNACYKETVESQLPGINSDNIICEPVGRNTAPCIGLALNAIRKRFEDAVMIVLPSDHVVKNPKLFMDTLTELVEAARTANGLFTIGIRPNYPETGYGYIKYIPDDGDGIYKVERFVEKPDAEHALKYLREGNYLWNSGMFVWRMSVLYDEYKKYAPDILDTVEKYDRTDDTQVRDEIFASARAESVDVAILEKTDKIYTVIGDFGWDDAGSFAALKRIGMTDDSDNYLEGNVIADRCTGCVIKGGERLIAVSGVNDVVIVDADDALLVCPVSEQDSIKTLINSIESNNMERYL